MARKSFISTAMQRAASFLVPEPRAVTAASKTYTPDIRALAAEEIRRAPNALHRALWYAENVDAIINSERWLRNLMADVMYLPTKVGSDGRPTECDDIVVSAVAMRANSGDWGRLASLVAFSGIGWVTGKYFGMNNMQWNIYSVDEFRWDKGDDKSPTIIENRFGTGRPMWRDGVEEQPLWFKVYYPSLSIGNEPYTPLMGQQALEVCEALLLITTVEVAVARSRLSNGILYIPSEVQFLQVLSPEEGAALIDQQPADILRDYMLSPITDTGSPDAVVPIVIRGPAEYAQALRHLMIERANTPEDFATRRDAFLKELAMLLPVPEAVLMGLGDATHWSASLNEDSSLRVYWKPLGRLIATALTNEYLRPYLAYLLDIGFWKGDPFSYSITADMSMITRKPGDWQRDMALYNAGLLKAEAVLNSVGYGKGDMASEADLKRIVALKAAGRMLQNPQQVDRGGNVDPGSKRPLIPDPGQPTPSRPTQSQNVPSKQEPSVAPANRQDQAARDKVTKQSAALMPARDEGLAKFADVLESADERLRGSLTLVAAQCAKRALRQLGKRAFKATADNSNLHGLVMQASPDVNTPENALRVKGVLAATKDWQQVIMAEIQSARETVLEEIDATHKAADAAVAELAGVDVATVAAVTWDSRQKARQAASEVFSKGMANILTGALKQASSGETSIPVIPHVPPGLVTATVAASGGTPFAYTDEQPVPFPVLKPDTLSPVIGAAAGSHTAQAANLLAGASITGYEWRRSPSSPNPHPGHVAMSGVKFSRLDDDILGGMHPGDHKGCSCSVRVQWTRGIYGR